MIEEMEAFISRKLLNHLLNEETKDSVTFMSKELSPLEAMKRKSHLV